jgi:hypothetical protein
LRGDAEHEREVEPGGVRRGDEHARFADRRVVADDAIAQRAEHESADRLLHLKLRTGTPSPTPNGSTSE